MIRSNTWANASLGRRLRRWSALLEKRLNAKEKLTEQNDVILFSGLVFLATFVIAGLIFWFVLSGRVSCILYSIFYISGFAGENLYEKQTEK